MTVARKWNGSASFNGRLEPLEDAVSFTARHFTIFQTHLDRLPKYEHQAVSISANGRLQKARFGDERRWHRLLKYRTVFQGMNKILIIISTSLSA
ncbi:hypothetical protein PO124_10035 [Bacillus licheniformis]|nr:hypothetical protein [Bacillus licheniformis]